MTFAEFLIRSYRCYSAFFLRYILYDMILYDFHMTDLCYISALTGQVYVMLPRGVDLFFTLRFIMEQPAYKNSTFKTNFKANYSGLYIQRTHESQFVHK